MQQPAIWLFLALMIKWDGIVLSSGGVLLILCQHNLPGGMGQGEVWRWKADGIETVLNGGCSTVLAGLMKLCRLYHFKLHVGFAWWNAPYKNKPLPVHLKKLVWSKVSSLAFPLICLSFMAECVWYACLLWQNGEASHYMCPHPAQVIGLSFPAMCLPLLWDLGDLGGSVYI